MLTSSSLVHYLSIAGKGEAGTHAGNPAFGEREREKKTIEFVEKMLKAFELVKQHSELIPLPQRPPIVF